MKNGLKRHRCADGFKRLAAIFFVILIALSAVTGSAFALTDAPKGNLLKSDLLNMDKSELLAALEANGLWLPPDFAAHRTELTEPFMYKYTHMLLEGKAGFNYVSFDYDQSNIAFENLVNVLVKMGFSFETRATSVHGITHASNGYSLKNSTAIGTWNNSFANYNCCAYAIGKTTWTRIGEPSGKRDQFSISMPISQMADLIIADLDKMGYSAYKTTGSTPDVCFKIICVRNGSEDSLLMNQNELFRMRKPGISQPLSDYAFPSAAVLKNERMEYWPDFAPEKRCDSTVYYILYRKKEPRVLQSTEHSFPRSVYENTVYSD